MTNEAYMAKKAELDAIEELLEGDGYKILAKEIERLRDQGIADCCNVELTSAKRDAGAGARNMATLLLDYLSQKKKSLELTLGKEKESRSRKRQSQ